MPLWLLRFYQTLTKPCHNCPSELDLFKKQDKMSKLVFSGRLYIRPQGNVCSQDIQETPNLYCKQMVNDLVGWELLQFLLFCPQVCFKASKDHFLPKPPSEHQCPWSQRFFFLCPQRKEPQGWLVCEFSVGHLECHPTLKRKKVHMQVWVLAHYRKPLSLGMVHTIATQTGSLTPVFICPLHCYKAHSFLGILALLTPTLPFLFYV